MATNSFLKEYSVNKKNAKSATNALNASFVPKIEIGQRVEHVSKDQLKKFFGKNAERF